VCFLRLLRLVFQTLRNTLPEHLLKPPNATVCRSHAQLHPYCLRLFLKKTSMGIPPLPPRATITLGLGLIRHIRRFRTFKYLKAFGTTLRLPSQSPDRLSLTSSWRTSYNAWSLQNPLHLSLEPPSTHHQLSPSERSIWSSTRQASRKESARGSNYTSNLTCADVSSPTRPLKTSRTCPPPRRWIRRVCLLGPVNASPALTVKMCTLASPRTGCLLLGLWGSRPTCEDSFGMSPAPLTALSSTYPLW